MLMARWRARLAGVVMTLGALVAVTGCTTGSPEPPPQTPSVPQVDFDGRGPITLVAGEIQAELLESEVEAWNEEHTDEEVTLVSLPARADDQHDELVAHFEESDPDYSVISMDVVWTPEFADKGWVLPLPDIDTSAMMPIAVDSATWNGQLYGVPITSNGALLFIRPDWLTAAGVDSPPTTFTEVRAACAAIKEKVAAAAEADCYGSQFATYEGLAVNLLEFVESSGGHLIGDDGVPTANGDAVLTALTALKELFDDGTIPAAARDWSEEESRAAFERGELIFLRTWPYAYATFDAEGSAVRGKFTVAPIPGVNGPGVSALGGHNFAISSFAENRATALDFINQLATRDAMAERTAQTAQAPTLIDLYADNDLVRQYPYLPVLEQSIVRARPRPQVVRYDEVSQAIQDTVDSVLSGDEQPVAALDQLQQELTQILG